MNDIVGYIAGGLLLTNLYTGWVVSGQDDEIVLLRTQLETKRLEVDGLVKGIEYQNDAIDKIKIDEAKALEDYKEGVRRAKANNMKLRGVLDETKTECENIKSILNSISSKRLSK